MTAVVSFLLIAVAGLFVAWPFMRGGARAVGGTPNDLSPLERQKLDALTALKEAEFDWRMGKLSDADFAGLREKYRQQALAAIAALEETRPRGVKREKKPAGTRPPRRIAFCPSCGANLPARANFCGRCGRSLRELVA